MRQRKYSLELIAEAGLGGEKPCITPIDTNTKLTTKQYNDHLKDTGCKTHNNPFTNQHTY